jgi:hypothetical protein
MPELSRWSSTLSHSSVSRTPQLEGNGRIGIPDRRVSSTHYDDIPVAGGLFRLMDQFRFALE